MSDSSFDHSSLDTGSSTNDINVCKKSDVIIFGLNSHRCILYGGLFILVVAMIGLGVWVLLLNNKNNTSTKECKKEKAQRLAAERLATKLKKENQEQQLFLLQQQHHVNQQQQQQQINQQQQPSDPNQPPMMSMKDPLGMSSPLHQQQQQNTQAMTPMASSPAMSMAMAGDDQKTGISDSLYKTQQIDWQNLPPEYSKKSAKSKKNDDVGQLMDDYHLRRELQIRPRMSMGPPRGASSIDLIIQ